MKKKNFWGLLTLVVFFVGAITLWLTSAKVLGTLGDLAWYSHEISNLEMAAKAKGAPIDEINRRIQELYNERDAYCYNSPDPVVRAVSNANEILQTGYGLAAIFFFVAIPYGAYTNVRNIRNAKKIREDRKWQKRKAAQRAARAAEAEAEEAKYQELLDIIDKSKAS